MDEMAETQVIEGIWEDITSKHGTSLKGRRVRLIVVSEDEQAVEGNLFHATPEERAKALDAIAEMNASIPPLPSEAFERESIYY
jgi:hypothetical protein